MIEPDYFTEVQAAITMRQMVRQGPARHSFRVKDSVPQGPARHSFRVKDSVPAMSYVQGKRSVPQ